MMISPRKNEKITSFAVALLFIISLSNCCTDLELTCENGECLPFEKICDGRIDCPGGADETPDTCIQLVCPSFSFRCAYGACVPDTARCNGTAECADKSDEAVVLCNSDLIKENTICQKDEFQCNSGECISQDNVCDGRADCLDRSDESVEVCASNSCEMFFRCGYGGCIRSDKKCDSVYDCADGSDETFNLCGVPPPPKQSTLSPRDPFIAVVPQTQTPAQIPTSPTTVVVVPPSGACVVPHIDNSRIVFEESHADVSTTGGVVPNFQSVIYQCRKGFFREGPEFNLCRNGKWYTEVHSICTRYCPDEILRGVTFNVECLRDGITVSCNHNIKPGTVAKVTCPEKYRIPDHNPVQNLLCLESGQWDYSPSRCVPVCGEELIPSVPFLVNGKNTNITAVPWHVGVYINNGGVQKHHCGGTIISAKIVVSAAHCFWDNANEDLYDKSLYSIGAGKYFRDYYQAEARKAQFRNISQIAVPSEYKGENAKYKADLAVVVLVNPLIFSDFVSPICIQWKRDNGKSIKTGSYGQVAGWGKDESGDFSSVLKTILVPASSNEICQKEVEERYADSITDDKFCVLNKFNTNACQGDSGGGFAAKVEVAGRNRYYLWGVVSTGVPLGLTCVNYQFVSYTNIQYYESFIINLEISNRAR